MRFYTHHQYKVLAIALLSFVALNLNCSSAQAGEGRVHSLMKCLSSARLSAANAGTEETIPASLIKEDSFDANQLDSIDLTHVIPGPLSQENLFHLSSGNALFTPKKDIAVLTALGKVNIGAGSIVCILKPEPGAISIYNLHAGNNNKVNIEIGQKSFALAPGMQATICYQVCEFGNINPAKRIAYRNLRERDLPAGIRLYSAEFSIPSAMSHIRPLQILLASNSKEDIKLADQLVKDSIVLDDLYNTAEPYSVAADPQPEPTRMAVAEDSLQEIAHQPSFGN